MTGQLITPSIKLINEYPYINFFDNNNIKRGEIYNSKTGRFNIREMSEDGNGYYDSYYLPAPGNLTQNTDYAILTKKNYLDMIYPVGSVYVTSTNTNPSSTLGGTWTLTDKEFAYASFSIADIFTTNTTNCTSLTGTIVRNNHFFTVYFTLTPKVAITDSTLVMGTFNLNSIGASSVNSQAYSSMSDGGQATFVFNITSAGEFSTRDVMVRGSSTASSAAAQAVNGYCIIPVTTSQMVDSACSRFFWKRTA